MLEWRTWLMDGGSEAGEADVVLEELGSYQRVAAERSQPAARSGSYGCAITAGPREGITFSLRVCMETGETTLFSNWARSRGGELSLQPTVWAFAAGQDPRELCSPPAPVGIRTDRTQVSLQEEQRGVPVRLAQPPGWT